MIKTQHCMTILTVEDITALKEIVGDSTTKGALEKAVEFTIRYYGKIGNNKSNSSEVRRMDLLEKLRYEQHGVHSMSNEILDS